ncbi:uncharacterized protein LOC113029020 [Astatotilapia calliptera]|uniref:uncharacterized protein LOC113029020 n=1 Tax=Astatotilapia calliptera TaxID=8154 RepID=UPI000E419BE6|nr:uncharacterized protein LOC113029020 [Astatotilapia calliptera]
MPEAVDFGEEERQQVLRAYREDELRWKPWLISEEELPPAAPPRTGRPSSLPRSDYSSPASFLARMWSEDEEPVITENQVPSASTSRRKRRSRRRRSSLRHVSPSTERHEEAVESSLTAACIHFLLSIPLRLIPALLYKTCEWLPGGMYHCERGDTEQSSFGVFRQQHGGGPVRRPRGGRTRHRQLTFKVSVLRNPTLTHYRSHRDATPATRVVVPVNLNAAEFRQALRDNIADIPLQFDLCKVNGQRLILPLEEETPQEIRARNLLGRSNLYIRPKITEANEDSTGGEVVQSEMAILFMVETQNSLGIFEGKPGSLLFSYSQQLLSSNKFYTAGKLIAWSIAHNGPGPRCINRHLFCMMCGQKTSLDDFDVEVFMDEDIKQNIEKVSSCSTPEDLADLKSHLGDWIAGWGIPDIYTATLLDVKRIRGEIVSHFAFHRVASMIQQFVAGMDSCGRFWQMVKRCWKQFLPVFTNAGNKLTRNSFQDLFTIGWSPAGSNRREEEEATIFQWEWWLMAIQGEVFERKPPTTNIFGRLFLLSSPQPQLRLVLRLLRRHASHVLDIIAGMAATVFLAAAHQTCSGATAVFLAAAHQNRLVSTAAAVHRTGSVVAAAFLAAAHLNCLVSATWPPTGTVSFSQPFSCPASPCPFTHSL